MIGITPNHMLALGSFTVNWANMEHSLQSILWKLLNIDWIKGACITQHMASSALCNAIISLSEIEFLEKADELNELKEIIRKFESLRTTRNDLIHGSWGITPSTMINPHKAALIKTSAKRSFKRSVIEFTAEDTGNLSKEVLLLQQTIIQFLSKISK